MSASSRLGSSFFFKKDYCSVRQCSSKLALLSLIAIIVLIKKRSKKIKASEKNRLRLFAMPKCGWAIFEQSSQLPSLTKALLQSATYFFGGQWPQCKGISIDFLFNKSTISQSINKLIQTSKVYQIAMFQNTTL